MRSGFRTKRHIDLTGRRVGGYVVVERIANRGARPAYRCKCDCGAIFERIGQNITSKNAGAFSGCKSCVARSIGELATTHGDAHAPLFNRWSSMRQRCSNPSCRVWKWYGGKGVRVCDEWLQYDNFKAWSIAHGYRDGLHLDRIDPTGNYEPSNCEWVTHRENAQRAAESRGRRRKSRWHSLAYLRKRLVHYRAENLFLRKVVREEIARIFAREFATEDERAAMDAAHRAEVAKLPSLKKLYGVN